MAQSCLRRKFDHGTKFFVRICCLIFTACILYFRGGCGYGSESEGEEPVDARVMLPQNVPGRGNVKAQQSAIRLTEVYGKLK